MRASAMGRKRIDVRLRAERSTGELLKELSRSKGGRPNGNTPATVAGVSEYREALNRTGTSERTAERYQALADIPSETFESHLANPIRKPATNRIISEARDPQPKAIDDNALWIWGRARDFEKDGYVRR
jgi:hypothetical protein